MLAAITNWLQPLTLYPWHFIGIALLSLLVGALSLGGWLYRRHARWEQETEARLEDSIQTRTFELQVVLNELADKNRILEEQNTLDALSGVRNRAYFDKKFLAELKRSRREQRPLALVMLDIDHFKQINDGYGHLAGDAVIRGVAQRIQGLLKRSSDHVCRYGGEEFALILPNTDAAGVMTLAEQIRQSIAEQPFHTEVAELSVQVSVGCYVAIASADMVSTDFIHAADQALYQAKTAGRNQIKLYPSPPTEAESTEVEGNPDELEL